MLSRIGAFLKAEEIPRWFGLSIVLIYLVGLGAISRFGIAAAHREVMGKVSSGADYAAGSLSREIGSLETPVDDDVWLPAVRIAVRRLLLYYPGTSMMLCDATGKMLYRADGDYSISCDPAAFSEVPSPELVNGSAGPIDSTTISQFDSETFVYRMKIQAVGADEALLCAVRIPALPDGGATSARVSLMLIVLVVLGALFVVYRCLRQQWRDISWIANRLQVSPDQVDGDLSSFRIAEGHDVAAHSWNQIVDLAQHSLDRSRCEEADAELSRVLSRASGGVLADALHAVPDGILLVTEGERFEYANAAACALFGWKPEEARGKTLEDTEGPEVYQKVAGMLRAAQQPEGSFLPCNDLVQTDKTEGGDPDIYRVWILPVRRPRYEDECMVVVRDVTQQSRADRAREELIAQVTHELRTPLTNIRAYSETLSSGMFEDPQVVTECYNVINKETRRLSRLIDDMLNVSQLEVGSIELAFDQVDLGALLQDSVQDVRGLADEKNIDVQLLLPPKLEPVRADRDKLSVVVNNLLGNAIKYTQSDGHVIVGCQIGNGSAVITVKDNGVGIAEEEHSKIFEKFYRVSDDDVQSVTGTGIGLYTAREIVRRHGGDIELISMKGEGSTFMVKIPHTGSRASNLSSEVAAV